MQAIHQFSSGVVILALPSISLPFFQPAEVFWMAMVVGAVVLEGLAAVGFRLRLF